MSYHLRLRKGLSYSGVVSATRQKPDVYVADGSVADRAVATGYFELVESADAGKKIPGKKSAEPGTEGK